MDIEIKSYTKCLYDILVIHNHDFIDAINQLQISSMSAAKIDNLTESVMDEINRILEDLKMYTESFKILTNERNRVRCFQYLIEMIQHVNLVNLSDLKEMWDKINLNKEMHRAELLSMMPIKLAEFRKFRLDYVKNPSSRIRQLASLKEFATLLFRLLLSVSAEEQEPGLWEGWLDQLLQESVVLTEYPPRIVRKATGRQTGTQFKATISCLVEHESLMLSQVECSAYMMAWDDVEMVMDSMNSQANMEMPSDCRIQVTLSADRQHSWSMKNMIWKPPERLSRPRSRTERITCSRSVIVFRFCGQLQVTPSWSGGEGWGYTSLCNSSSELSQLRVILRSDSCVTIVHTSQETDAQLTLFWDDFFHDQNIQISIEDLVKAVSDKFQQETKRCFSHQNVAYLTHKLGSYCGGYIDFCGFSRTLMPGSSLSPGHWFFGILKLIKCPGVWKLWERDYIVGFCNKEFMPLRKPRYSSGTFILRFSETQPKIGVLVRSQQGQLHAWNPFSFEEFKTRSLAAYLTDYNELTWLMRADEDTVSNKAEDLSELVSQDSSEKPDYGYTRRGELLRCVDSIVYCPDEELGDLASESEIDIDNIYPDDLIGN